MCWEAKLCGRGVQIQVGTYLPTKCDSTYWTLAAQDVERKNIKIQGNLNFNVKFHLDLSLQTVLQITLT